jgi:hypothetical protein
MLTRRIAASACALCLAIPALATAKDVRFVGHSHHAFTVAPAGDTKSDLPGAVAATPPTHASTPTASRADRGDGWRLAAAAEAGLLAAFATGAAAFGRKHRAPHLGV